MSNEPYLLISKIQNRTCVFLEHILLYFCRHQTYEFSCKQTNYGILSLDRYIRVPLHPFPLAQITQSSKKGKEKQKQKVKKIPKLLLPMLEQGLIAGDGMGGHRWSGHHGAHNHCSIRFLRGQHDRSIGPSS
jgi:hypothetical protein